MRDNRGTLKDRNFILLMIGKCVSLMGTQMQNFALSLYVLKITGSATKFASVLAVTILPKIILGPMAGVLADWFDRKKIIVYLDVLRGVIIGIFAVMFAVRGELSLMSIYILVIAMSMASLMFQPAILTVIPTIIKKDNLVEANGINSLLMNVTNFISPALAGILMGFYGIFAILMINSISFIVSAVSEVFIAIPKTNKKPKKITVGAFKKDFMDGISFIREKKLIVTVIIIACILNFAFAPAGTIGLTFIAKNVLKVTDSQFGIMQSILIASMILAPIIATKVAKKYDIGKLLFWDILITGILIGIMAIIPSSLYLNMFDSNMIPYITLIGINFMIGLILSAGNIALSIIVQQQVPLELMGRVGTVRATGAMAAVPLGQMFFGFMFDKVAPWICPAISSAILITMILVLRGNLIENGQEQKIGKIQSEV